MRRRPAGCQCADRRRGAYQAVVKAGLDPAAVLLEVPVPAMNTRCGADAGDQLRAAVVPGVPGVPSVGAPTAAFCTNDLLALGLLRLGSASSARRCPVTWRSSATTTSTSPAIRPCR